MPRSRNLDPEAPRPGNVDLNRKMIRKMNVLDRGSRILESKGPGGGGKRPRSRNLGPEAPRPGNVDLNRKIIRKRNVLESPLAYTSAPLADRGAPLTYASAPPSPPQI